MPIDPTEETAMATAQETRATTPPNGSPEPSGSYRRDRDIDPAVALLIQEVRRGNDALRREMCAAQRETTEAIGGLSAEMRALRDQAPGRLSFYLASAVVVLALVSLLALVASRGIDPGVVSDAVRVVAPVAP